MTKHPEPLHTIEDTAALDAAVRLVCSEYGVTAELLKGKRRFGSIVQPRQVAMWLVKTTFPNTSWRYIGWAIGRRDHSTAIHAVQTIEDYRETDRRMRDKTDKLLNLYTREIDSIHSVPFDTHINIGLAFL